MAASSAGPGAPHISPSMVGLPPWWGDLKVNDKGNPRAILLNGDIALSHDPAFAGAIQYDAFRSQTMLCARVPWDQVSVLPRQWTDQDDYMACKWLQDWGILLGVSVVHEVVEGIARRSVYHPVVDHLAAFTWDNVPRLDRFAPYYLGAEDTPFARAVVPRWMISAVARVMEPGCQADSVLVLEGDQGIGKSSTFRILGGAWYSNTMSALGTKDAMEQTIGTWIQELDELDAVNRAADWSAVLSFVSRGTDRFRFSYARHVIAYPRQCVFGATTNREDWLPGSNGRRRFWPIRCGPAIDLDALTHDRDQLWAEAVHRYFAGEKWFLHEDELRKAADAEQMERIVPEAWEEHILNYIGGRNIIIVAELLCDHLKIPIDRVGKADMMRAATFMRNLGWARKKITTTDVVGKTKQRWCFVSPAHPAHPHFTGN